MTDTIERFTNRVDNYVKYRPDYPREVVAFLASNCGLTRRSVVADIGCGTGISTKMFLEHGCRVFGIEPNEAMRLAAEKYLAAFPWFIAFDGTSDATGLSGNSVDLVVAAQAFHWFDPERSRAEFHRILKPNGHVVLIWNEREIDTTPFLTDYEQFLVKYAYDYGSVRHENIKAEELNGFFQADYGTVVFDNQQVFDLEGITGRMLSSSYMPNDSDKVFPAMVEELRSLFAKHAESDRIKVLYKTKVYFSQV